MSGVDWNEAPEGASYVKVDSKDEFVKFSAWWLRTIPHVALPSVTSHFFDTWMASARCIRPSAAEAELRAEVSRLKDTDLQVRRCESLLDMRNKLQETNDALIAERDQLRAEVERLRTEGDKLFQAYHEAASERDKFRLKLLDAIMKIQSVETERDQLRADLERARADAARYRWLRDVGMEDEWTVCRYHLPRHGVNQHTQRSLDAAIDAAMHTAPSPGHQP